MQVRRNQHESKIGFRRNDTKSKQLRRLHRPDILHKRGEIGFRRILFLSIQQLPLPIFDPVKQMHAMPALLGHKRNTLIGHRASLRPAKIGSSSWTSTTTNPRCCSHDALSPCHAHNVSTERGGYSAAATCLPRGALRARQMRYTIFLAVARKREDRRPSLSTIASRFLLAASVPCNILRRHATP